MAQGLKFLVGGTLVVPPFECAWLTGQDLTFSDGQGCICFEAKADTDVTVILKATPGARRWQPLQRASEGAAAAAAAAAAPTTPTAVEPNYTVIFGSHRNSCLKFEKNGTTRGMVRGVAGSRVSGKEFQQYWVHYSNGGIAVGTGEPCLEHLSYRWRDDDPAGPIPDIRHVGLSCWDRHACYRSIKLHPRPLLLPDGLIGRGAGGGGGGVGPDAEGESAAAGGLPTPLLQLCCRAVERELLGPGEVCRTLWAAELLLPNTHLLYRSCLHSLAKQLEAVHRLDAAGWACLSASSLVDLLQQNDIPVGEKAIFDMVLDWARGYGAEEEGCTSAGVAEGGRGGGGMDVYRGSGGECEEGGTEGWAVEGGADVVAAPSSPSDLCVSSCHREQLEADICLVLSMIRYPLMTSQELHQVQACPLVQAHAEVQALVDEALGLPLMPTLPVRPRQEEAEAEDRGQAKDQGAGAAGEDRAAWAGGGVVQEGGGGGGGVRRKSIRESGGSLGLGVAVAGGGGVAAAAAATPGSAYCVENKRLLRNSLEGAQAQLHAHACRFQRRCVPAARELSYVCDGDQHGVLRYIGTLYGTQEWVNPVLTKRVDIKASSPTARGLTDPKALAGDKFVRHNFAGPRYINGKAVTWWCVDLGAAHQLLLNYYTLRHDGCTDYPRHWVLQGSQDCSEWVDLRRHSADNSLRKPGQYASWAVLGPAASTPYRAFRLLLEGPTTSSTAPHMFCLSNLELYGYLSRQEIVPGVPRGVGGSGGLLEEAGPGEGT